MPQRMPPRRLRRWAVAIAVGVVLLLALVLGTSRVFLHGDDLGDFVAGMLNKRMRGRIEIGAIEWPVSSIPTMISGGWVPVTVRDVRLWDDCMQSAAGRRQRAIAGSTASSAPGSIAGTQLFVADLPCAPDNRRADGLTPRRKLLETSEITAEIDVHALFFGNHDLVFRNVHVHGGEVLLEQSAEPFPLHDYDKTTISLVSAFQPRMKAGFRAGIFADKAPPIFDLRDLRLEGIGVTYHHRPELKDGRARYPITLRVENVNAAVPDPKQRRPGPPPPEPALDVTRPFLYADNSDPLVGKLYLSVPLKAGPATLRIDDEGPAEDFEIGPLRVEHKERRKPRYIIELASIDVQRLAQLPRRWIEGDPIARTLELRLIARTAQGGTVKVAGELRDYWDRPFDGTWALDVEGRNLGPTVTASIDPALSGDSLHADLRLRGPFIANPKIEYVARGLEFETLRPKEPTDPPALRLALAQLNGELDLVNDQGHLDETIAQVLDEEGQPTRGKIQLDATFGLKPYQINNADVKILEAIDLGRFLPESARKHLGRYVRGDFSGNGDTTSGFALRNIDLVIGQRPTDVTARLFGGRIFTTDNFSTLEVAREQPLRARVGKTSATISGSILARTRWLKLKLSSVESPDLGQWLRRLGISPIATSASDGSVEIVGPITAPAIDATALLAGIPILGQAQLSTHFENQVIDITSVQSGTLGGSLAGRGKVRLSAVAGGAPFIESLTVTGKKLSAEKMAAAGGLAGKASGTVNTVEISARGSLGRRDNLVDWLDLVDAYIQADRLTLYGDDYEDIGVCISRTTSSHPQCRRRDDALADASEAACAEIRRKGGSCVMAHASRQGGGDVDVQLSKLPGALLARGRRGPSVLAGKADISALPLAFLDRFALPGTFGGTVGAQLSFGGTAEAPTISGPIELFRVWAKGAFFGDSKLEVNPVGRTLELTGTALGGQITLRATVGTAAPYPIDLVLTGRRIELDSFIADLLPPWLSPLRVWATGEIRYRADGAPPLSGGREPELWMELSELEAIYDYRDGDQPSPLRFAALPIAGSRSVLSLRRTPTSVELACPDAEAPGGRRPCPARFSTPVGPFTIEGKAVPEKVQLAAFGRFDLSLLAPLLGETVDELSGVVETSAQVGGPWTKPTFEVDLRPTDIRARPTGTETVLRIPGGLARYGNDAIGFVDMRVLVDDTHLKEGSELTLGGNLVLKDGLRWGVTLSGKIAGKLLLALLPNQISQAGGVALIDQSAILTGTGMFPSISGTLLFEPSAPLTLIPRGLRRELSFHEGSVSVETGDTIAGSPTYIILPEAVTASIDGEGALRNLSGELQWRSTNRPPPKTALQDIVKADLRFDADAIPFKVPGTLDLLLTGTNLRVRRESETRPFLAEGSVEIVDGKYIRDIDFRELARPAVPAAGDNRPFWEQQPELGNARLNLKVGVRKMAVKNNVGEINLSGELSLVGTPRDPRANGTISVQDGTFRFPGTRASFTRIQGTVDFSPQHPLPEQTPTLAIQGEADYRDPTGRDHLITIIINGPLSQLTWELNTSTGYNKSQALALLIFGRTPDQVRQSIGDGAVGSDPTRIDPSTNPSAGAADQLIKDFAGSWVSLLLGNSLEELTGLDVLRFQVDFGSIGLHGEKKVFENVLGVFDLEQTVRGSTVNARVEVRTPFRVTLTGAYLNKNFDSEAEEDIRDRQLKLVYRFFIP
jgi:TamB, inner membrane protein subunit of TAM complex